jgi:hypothetical protein
VKEKPKLCHKTHQWFIFRWDQFYNTGLSCLCRTQENNACMFTKKQKCVTDALHRSILALKHIKCRLFENGMHAMIGLRQLGQNIYLFWMSEEKLVWMECFFQRKKILYSKLFLTFTNFSELPTCATNFRVSVFSQ